jgi:PAS domain S-box-containing protein
MDHGLLPHLVRSSWDIGLGLIPPFERKWGSVILLLLSLSQIALAVGWWRQRRQLKAAQVQLALATVASQQQENDRQSSPAQLQDLLDSIIGSIICFRLFPDYRYEYIFLSAGTEIVFGYQPEEFISDPKLWLSRVPAADEQAAVLTAWQEACAGKSGITEYRFRHKDGSVRWISSRFSSNWDADNQAWIVTGLDVDITAQKQAEQALKHSEEQLRQIIDNSKDVFFLRSLEDGDLIYINQMYEKLYQTPPDFLYEQPQAWTNSIHPKDRDRVLAKFTEESQGKEFFNDEYRVILPDGSIRWIWDSSFPIRDPQGRIYRIAGINRDITERKLIEQALQTSEARFRALIDNLPLQVWAVDVDNRYVIQNQVSQSYWGSFIGLANAREHWPADLADQWQQNRDRAWSGEVVTTEEIRTIQGQTHVFSKIVAPIRHGDQIEGLVGVSIDITERTQMEKALRLSEQRFRRIFEYAPVGIIVVSPPDYKLIQTNPAFQRLLGYSSDELCELDAVAITHPEDWIIEQECILQCFEQRYEHYSLEKRYIRKDNQTIWGKLTCSLLWSPEGDLQFVIAMVKDITQRKLTEAELLRSLQEKNTLLKEVHHRVKNNLQIITSLLRLQARSVPDPRVKAALEDTQNRIYSMALIHENLYQSEQFDRVNLLHYLDTLVRNLEMSASRPDLQVDVQIADLTISMGKAILCGLIVNELVTNAFKYAFPDCSGQIRVQVDRLDREAVLTVCDSGIGLPEAVDPRMPASLGLSIVNELVDQLHATLELTRTPGTTFRIAFSPVE